MLGILESVHAVKSNIIENIFYTRLQGILFMEKTMKETWKHQKAWQRCFNSVKGSRIIPPMSLNILRMTNTVTLGVWPWKFTIFISLFFFWILCFLLDKTFWKTFFPPWSLLILELSAFYTILDILESRVPVKYWESPGITEISN